ncbi:MAG: patatin-like phospholipase family protein [Woeseia sp.]
MKTVLTIDGGGVRGIVSALILAEIEKRMKCPAHKLFDVIAGTSTGAFVGALAARKSDSLEPLWAQEIVELYRKDAKKYFKRRAFWPIAQPKFENESVKEVLQHYLGDADLKRTATRFIAPVYALRDTPPRVHYFSSLAAGQIASDNHLLWQVVRGATAAPSYFEPFDVHTANGLFHSTVIDGGVYANNPAMLGWLHAHQSLNKSYVAMQNNTQHKFFSLDEQFDTDEKSLQETVVVSLGTGFSDRPINPDKAKKWGRLGWFFPLLDVIVEGQADQSTAEMRIAKNVKLLKYFERLQPPLARKIKLDDVKKLPFLEEATHIFLTKDPGKTLINDVCQQLETAMPCGKQKPDLP